MIVITDEAKKAIKDKINLLEYLQQYFPFERRSNKYFTCCPFHDEKTPSFMVDPESHYYHCFGCGESGDIITFVMKYEGLTYPEAVTKLAQIAGVGFSMLKKSNTVEILKSYKPCRHTPYNHVILPEETYDNYSIGRITSWEQEGISPEIISAYDIRLDTRAQRIVYPVRDINGQLINIKGRTLVEDFKSLRIPKYINYYKVGCMDYLQGLDKKKELIKASGEVIIFEGVKSCMKLDDWCESPCVSSETAGLTQEQIELILRLHCNVVIAYDQDKTLQDIYESVKWISRFTNLDIISDPQHLLGDVSNKNSPVDMGYDVWQELYKNKERVVL